MALIKCKECGNDVSSSAKTCPHCGIEINNIPEKSFCPECGNKVNNSDDFCPECGFPIKKKSAQTKIYDSLDKITGAKVEKYVTFKDLFKNTFKKHTEDDMDEVFTCGGKNTTANIATINPKNASAWVYIRILLFFLIAFIPMYIGYINYGNMNFLPGMIILAAFAVPITVLIFFFEINLFRNISFYKVLKYFVIGGCMSLILAILYFSLFTMSSTMTYWDAILVGVIEEVAKACIVVIFLFRDKKSNYILDGLLIGAAVGAGFAAFETAGYILRYGLAQGVTSMMEVIKLRAFLAPGGHVAWAAIEGAALMYVKGFAKLDKKHFNDKKFLIICLIPIALHSVWDMPINVPYYLVQITLIVLAWIVVVYFINLGLKQIDDAKKLENNKEAK